MLLYMSAKLGRTDTEGYLEDKTFVPKEDEMIVELKKVHNKYMICTLNIVREI
jgi:hypothetical protein